MNYLFASILAIILFFLLASYYFARVIIYPRVRPYEEVYSLKVEDGTLDPEEWSNWDKEEIWVDSDFGYSLHGYWLPVENPVGTVILVHGITVNHFASVKYVQPFRKRGFNVLMYDHRNHGKSGGKVTTFGEFEKYDLQSIVDWVVEKVGDDSIIGTHGESMGAATCLQHAAIDQRLSFVVSDCAYADLMDLFLFRLKYDSKLPGPIILPIASVFIRLIARFWPQEINPVEMMPSVETPIFFIHGADDKYIPPVHAQQIYEAKARGYRKLWFAPNAEHAMSQPTNPEVYDIKIGEFLKKIDIIE